MRTIVATVVVMAAAVVVVAVPRAVKPHIVFVLADDLGFYDTAIYNPDSPTPHIANLSASGLRLDYHYVFRYCSPTRRSFLSGRFPNHISTVQPDGKTAGNRSALCSDFLPLAFTILPQKLAPAGYHNHFVGKGHLGYETMDHLPINRGFLSHVGYLSGGEEYYHGLVGGGGSPGHDMWTDDKPGTDVVDSIEYSANYYTSTATSIIHSFAAEVAANTTAAKLSSSSSPLGDREGETAEHHRSTDPSRLFMYFAIQNVHSPYQLPPSWEIKNFTKFPFQTYANMLNMLDDSVHNLTLALQETQMWDETLLVFTADNGGIGSFGNNYPLRGHKHDPWEGGIRATAFMAGGFVPIGLRGKSSGPKLVHVADWYATFCFLAGVDATDDVMMEGKVRSIDSVNVWPMLTGENTTQPRALTPVTETAIIEVASDGTWWKLVTLAGQSNVYTTHGEQVACTDPCLTGAQPDPPEPGRTDPIVNGPGKGGKGCPVCNATMPCLYSLLDDPSESHNVATAHPDVVDRLTSPLAASVTPYVTGYLDAATLAANYTALPTGVWGDFVGPCYKRKDA